MGLDLRRYDQIQLGLRSAESALLGFPINPIEGLSREVLQLQRKLRFAKGIRLGTGAANLYLDQLLSRLGSLRELSQCLMDLEFPSLLDDLEVSQAARGMLSEIFHHAEELEEVISGLPETYLVEFRTLFAAP